MALGKKNSALGKNPLTPKTAQSIFTKTTDVDPEAQSSQSKASKASRIKNQESRFLENTEKEKVNLRLSIEINDWLDDLVKQGKRLHGSKIPKEIWVQAALEFFKSLPVDWQTVDSLETLQEKLKIQESRVKNQDS